MPVVPPPGGHYLDIVGPLVHEPAHGATDLFHSVGDLVAHVEMATRAGDRATADEQPRPGDVSAFQTLLEDEPDLVASAVLAQGGDTGAQVLAHVHGPDQYHGLVAFEEGQVVAAAVSRQAEVGVAIDETGCEAAAIQIDGRGIGRRLLLHLCQWSNRGDRAISYEYRLPGLGAAAETIGEQSRANQCRL